MREWLQDRLGMSPTIQTHLLVTIIVILGLWLLHRLILTVVYRRVSDPWARYRWRKTVSYVLLGIAILVIGREWIAGFRSVATFLGLVSAGLAIALKDPLTNLAGWAYILWRRPFDVGDRVEVAKHKGDVIDIRLFHFTLNEIGVWVDAEQSTGRILHIPNQQVFTEPIANYDKGFKYIWNEVPVLVTHESNWKKARELLTQIAFKHAEHLTAEAERELLAASRRYLINYRKLTPIVYLNGAPSGILLTIRYLIEPRRRRGSVSAIWEDILTEFGKAQDIEFSYHTVRGFSRPVEGKRAGDPPSEA